ncbi:MAG: sulfotransferase [Proteobacteria bacterium]|nr:sulfotransferase [Pseudomonadota bacterium]
MTRTALANALTELHAGNPARAQTLLRQAIATDPHDPDAANLAGMVELELGAKPSMPTGILRSLAMAPFEPEFLHNLGLAALRLDLLQTASTALKRALALDPAFADNHLDLGNQRARHGDYGEASRHYARAVALVPERIASHQNLGWALLAQGDFRRGFREYAWRWRDPRFAALRRQLEGAPWDGRRFNGVLLVFAEQGFGDTLQFSRLIGQASRRALRLVFEVQPELAQLMSRSLAPIEVVARSPGFPFCGDRPRHDRHAALLDLPQLLGIDLASLPAAEIPYLIAQPQKQRRWAQRFDLAAESRRRIGLVWAGNPRPEDPAAAEVDRRRSIPMDSLRALATVPDVTFVSLQTGAAAAAARDADFPLVDLAGDLFDFDETAAVISALDLVLTVDTAVAHLAGALGRPVWVLSRADGCWRWLTGRSDSPWYPTLRLFRQKTPGAWSDTIEEVAAALSQRAGRPPER